jgi:transposase
MTRLHGWAPKGQRLVDKIPHRRWKTATFLAALRNDRVDAPCLFDGPINGERFRAYVEQFLVPTLKPGDVVILDNLGSHKERRCDRRSELLGRASCSCRNTRPTSIQSSKSSPNSKPCRERPPPAHTMLSPTPAKRSSLNTSRRNAPLISKTPDMRRPKCRSL